MKKQKKRNRNDNDHNNNDDNNGNCNNQYLRVNGKRVQRQGKMRRA